MELIPGDEPIVHRTFMNEVGSRSILVGYPEMVHVAFDANNIRLAKAWRGRFFDAKGQWEGRGGQLLSPLGTDVIKLPPGPSFAVLDSPKATWPVLKYDERNPSIRFKGYVLDDAERPAFHYELSGEGGGKDGVVEIEEQAVPVNRPGKASIQRTFHLTSSAPPKGLYFLGGSGEEDRCKRARGVDGRSDRHTSPNRGGRRCGIDQARPARCRGHSAVIGAGQFCERRRRYPSGNVVVTDRSHW